MSATLSAQEDLDIQVRELTRVDAVSWNQRVESVPEGHICQTTHVEAFHMVTGGGYEPVYLVAENSSDKILGQLLLLKGFHLAPELFTRPWLKGMLPVCRSLFDIYTWSHGPLIFDRACPEPVFGALLQKVDEMARRDTYMVRQATLPHFAAGEELEGNSGTDLEEMGFARSEKATFYVELDCPIEDLWSGLKASARKNLKKLIASETLEVVELDEVNKVRSYWQMLVETQRRSEHFVSYRTFEEFKADFWDSPHAQGVLKGLLVQTPLGQPIAGLLFRVFNGWIQELGVAYTDYSIEHKIYGQDLIKWHLIQWGQRNGCRIYDLMGVDVGANEKKKQGIYQFKAKWGGRLCQYGVYDKIYAPWRAGVMNMGTRLARRIRGN